MKTPEQLREVTEHVLRGLYADEQLKNRIYQSAVKSDNRAEAHAGARRRPLILLCALSALMVALFAVLSSYRPEVSEGSSEIITISAGEFRNESPIRLQDVIDETVEQYESAFDQQTESEPSPLP